MEKQILDLFLFNHKLKFSKIEELLKSRSNKLAYHLNKLIQKGVLKKEKELYSLSETSEHFIPYLSDKKSALAVVLVHIGNKKSCFLHKRQKRPFKERLSLPGGRLRIKESINQCIQRIMKEKFDIKSKLKKINSISLEHVKSKKKIVHSFILIFATATTKQKIELTEIEKNKPKIISSDYNLLKNNLSKKVSLNIIYSST